MARKKKGLPFVVQPRLEPIIETIGTPESGKIEIIRRGYLTVAEKSIVDQATSDLSDQGELLAAVRAIAKAEKKTVGEIFGLLQNGKQSELVEKYTEEIAAASSSVKAQEDKVRIIAATALLMCRIDPQWSVEDSMELHPDLLAELYVLYMEEDARSLEAFETDGPEAGTKK